MSHSRFRWIGGAVVWLIAAMLIPWSGARAQSFGVAVSPAETTITVPGDSRQTQRFWVKNTGTAGQRHYVIMGPSCNAPVRDCVWSTFSLDIPQGDSGAVDVTFTAGPSGTTGNTHFDAVVNDQQSVSARGVVFVQASSAPAPDGLTVTPSSGTEDVPPYAQARQKTFIVKNTSGREVDVSIQGADCQPFEMFCAFSTQSLNDLAPNAEDTVTVTYTSGAPGWSGTIALVAKINDNQSVATSAAVTVQALSQAWLETKSLNPGTSVTRAACVSFQVATNSAYECADLTIAHLLPSLRLRNDDRTPALVYNSAHVDPRPVVLADISAPAGGATNISATLTVRRGGTDVQVTGPVSIADLAGATTRRIALDYDAFGDTTGVYPYMFTVTMTVGGTPQTLTVSDTLVVVNRKASAFGAGWWLAGYEKLVRLSDGGFLWIGGDGSTRRYVRDTARPGEAYGAVGFDRPDSLVLDGAAYVRKLRHRARVEFDQTGRHVRTVDPLGIPTVFEHDGAGRVQSILHPAASAPRHVFTYGAGDRLESVSGPAPSGGTRQVTLTPGANGRVERITDADAKFVAFGYATPSGVIITSRTNRNAVSQTFGFATNRLVQATIPLTATESAVTTFCPTEIRGLSTGGCGGTSQSPSEAVTSVDGPRTDVVDVSTIQTNRFGAAVVITDPLGHRTRLLRGNRTFSGLVTRVIHKNGWVNDAAYDGNGLLATQVQYAPLGPGQDAVTEYTWDPVVERVTSITFPERNVMRFGYDTTTGHRIWQEDGRGISSRVDFDYNGATGNGARLLASIRYPADGQGVRARDTLAYDALGNAAEQRTAVGTADEGVTRLTNDAAGRTIRTSVDIVAGGARQQRDSVEFDAIDRVIRTKSYGFGSAPESLFTATTYDDEGNRRRLERWSIPDIAASPIGKIITRWGYDRANRLVADSAPASVVAVNVERHAYDAAGNDTLMTTRRGHAVRMTYDALNRLRVRSLPSVTYAKRRNGVYTLGPRPDANVPYPRYPIAPGVTAVPDSTIGATTEVFDYDEMGNLITANNADAQVTRAYFSNGLMQSEVERIRTYSGNDFSAHAYTTALEYDLNGRRTRVTFPTHLMAGAGTSVTYQYSPLSGALERVTDPLGAAFTLHTDGRGQLDTLYMPGAIKEAFRYDQAGRIKIDSIANASTAQFRYVNPVLRVTSRTYDARGKALTSFNRVGALDSLTAAYTGLGYLARTRYRDHGVNQYDAQVGYTSTDTIPMDALGNAFAITTTTAGTGNADYFRFGGRALRYQLGTGRVGSIAYAGGRTDTLFYDAGGNTEFLTYKVSPPVNGMMIEDRAVYHDAIGRVRAVDHRYGAWGGYQSLARPLNFAFEEYRYDALGRRVLARTRRYCQQVPTSFECAVQTIRRTVWDGAQELVEIQMPGANETPAATLENDTQPLPNQPGMHDGNYIDLTPFFGRVAYAHAIGIDQPLSLTRFEYADSAAGQAFVRWAPFSLVPHWNVRGEADNGTFANGAALNCTDSTGQRCVRVQWPFGWTATQQENYTRITWHGTLIEQKRDASGLLFRRNRYVDPATGRFTQEDPIGLAGGLNLYGFAGGDPVNYSDPFGLCPVCDIADVGFFAYSAGKAIMDPSRENLTNAALDAVGLLPVIPSAGLVRRIADLRASGLKDAHHVIQDAAVRDLPGYSSSAAPGVHLPGPSNAVGSSHHAATRVQRQAGGGNYAAERRIGYKALRKGGLSEEQARAAIHAADAYFRSIGVTPGTTTRIPANRP